MCVCARVRVCVLRKAEFMRGLLILVSSKMENDISQLLSSDVLFAHYVDETLAFHRELHTTCSYPSLFHSGLHVLIQPDAFHKWKTIEKKCTTWFIWPIFTFVCCQGRRLRGNGYREIYSLPKIVNFNHCYAIFASVAICLTRFRFRPVRWLF